MIVATAGHVDHGKTSLIRALTGVDTDRLAEEKRRGMTIELGFAYADFGLASLVGFVDVPGHERFIRTMLAGVAAIDCALLVIAADDGPMPQTREHLAILNLLGVTSAVVALSKIDRVEPVRVSQVKEQIRALLAGSPLHAAPIVPVVAPSGEGLADLREALVGIAQTQAMARQAPAGNFRLAVDRAFVLSGAGLVVSGAVYSGQAQCGDRLVLSPAGVEVRVRSIHANNRDAAQARSGDRCALNLTGADLDRDQLRRGDWIVAPRAHAPTQRLDVELYLLEQEARPLGDLRDLRDLRDGSAVQLHLAAASVPARAALLQTKLLKPGTTGLAQLVLDKSIGALYGDRFVLRDQGSQRTLGGGRVIDPFGPVRGRAKPGRMLELQALRLTQADEAMRRLLTGKASGVNWSAFECARNLTPSEAACLHDASAARLLRADAGFLAIDTVQWDALRAQTLKILSDHHAQHAASTGPALSALLRLVRATTVESSLPICRAVVKSLVDDGSIAVSGLSLHMPGHSVRLSEQQQAVFDGIQTQLVQAGLRPPIVGELAGLLNIDLPVLKPLLETLSASGHLVAVASNRYFLPHTVVDLVRVARDLDRAAAGAGFDAAAYRDASGIGRNLTIQVLEFLDRQGFTRFARNRRWIVTAALPAELTELEPE